ncbi:hypothetical protein [Paenibacillus sp. FSL H8-0259]|uniref:hypothetical protein n=1 Tax=Paenibacillus sp. FSL H8-0259 TaxID=1920423 RepID=UPI00096CF8D7|nr:hypothetical protein [Paenibacillus sp. FSL H8-0259]OMF30935.1 hypothetical protein BK132_05765 [Paenibacillus sp. FSL H8-0259]
MSEITVNYVTQRSHCECCEQRLPQVETSKVKQFMIKTEDVTDWAKLEYWESSYVGADEFFDMVREFTNETIQFFAADMYDHVVIEKTELERVNEFIVREVLHQAVGHLSTE